MSHHTCLRHRDNGQCDPQAWHISEQNFLIKRLRYSPEGPYPGGDVEGSDEPPPQLAGGPHFAGTKLFPQNPGLGCRKSALLRPKISTFFEDATSGWPNTFGARIMMSAKSPLFDRYDPPNHPRHPKDWLRAPRNGQRAVWNDPRRLYQVRPPADDVPDSEFIMLRVPCSDQGCLLC